MTLTKRTFSLLLAMTPNIGGRSLVKILTRNEFLNRSPEQFLKLAPESLREEYRLNRKASESLQLNLNERISGILELEKRLSGLGVTWVTGADAMYPTSIEAMDPSPPGVLFLYGNTRLLDAKTFCVLASRKAMPADLDLIEKLTEESILNGEVLVTGHDNLQYQRSAVVPLRWGSPRILCLDRGLFQALGSDLKQEAFPAARLWRYEFDSETDLVVSAFRPEDPYIGKNNATRDKLVGCLSQRLDFVSIADGGNMDRLAKAALRAGRAVRVSDRVIPWRTYVEQGASVIRS